MLLHAAASMIMINKNKIKEQKSAPPPVVDQEQQAGEKLKSLSSSSSSSSSPLQDIQHICSIVHCDEVLARRALEQSKFAVNEAVILLLDADTRAILERDDDSGAGGGTFAGGGRSEYEAKLWVDDAGYYDHNNNNNYGSSHQKYDDDDEKKLEEPWYDGGGRSRNSSNPAHHTRAANQCPAAAAAARELVTSDPGRLSSNVLCWILCFVERLIFMCASYRCVLCGTEHLSAVVRPRPCASRRCLTAFSGFFFFNSFYLDCFSFCISAPHLYNTAILSMPPLSVLYRSSPCCPVPLPYPCVSGHNITIVFR